MVLSTADLLARANKLQREQAHRSSKAKQKAEAEKAAQARVRDFNAALEAEKARLRAEQLRAQEEAEERRAAELEKNNGVLYHAELAATPLDPAAATRRGIKRADDKVSLPRSVEGALMAQQAYKNGSIIFEVAHPNGRRTHVGVLDFTAAEGTVQLPEHVARCLFGPDSGADECSGLVMVRYSRLPKGTFARLQPRSAEFQSAMGDDIKDVLEAALHRRCTLTEGDWLRIAGPDGRLWDLRVKELQPAAQVNIVDTDLEAQLDPSVETEERIAAEHAAAARQLLAASALRAEAADAAQRARDAAAQQAAAAAMEAQARVARQRQRAEALAALPPEPDHGPVVACAVRLPDGSRCMRRFLASDSLLEVFAFVDACAELGEYALVTAFPRAVYGRELGGESLGGVFGMPGGGQVALLVETR